MKQDRIGVHSWRADLALLGVTLVWGATFVMVRGAVAHFPVFAFLTLRFSFALLALVGPAVAYHVSETMKAAYPERFYVSENLKRIVEAGRATFDAEAAALLQQDPSLRFVLCGNGAARERLQREYGALPNVAWLPLQPFSRLNELLNLADIHVLLQIAGVADLVMHLLTPAPAQA